MKSPKRTSTPAPADKTPPGQTAATSLPPTNDALIGRHLQFGWWALLIFLTAGLALEALQGFKVQAYLKVSNETRRLMWTLAHAHGTLLGLVNLAFAATLRALPAWPEANKRLASRALLAATVLMPAGFFLGGVFIYSGDPGLGILLVPAGGILLFAAVFLTARALKHLDSGAFGRRGPDTRGP
jgi:hypothetical protein